MYISAYWNGHFCYKVAQTFDLTDLEYVKVTTDTHETC